MSRFELPAELSWILRPHLAALGAELADALLAADPGLDTAPVRLGVAEALRQFVDDVELGHAARPRRLFANFGRTEMRAGRSLDGLLAAYRLGGRLAWRRFAAAAERAGVAPATVHALAEAVFSWVDELCDQSAAGWAAEASASASAAQLRRERLVRLLVAAEPPAERAVVEAAAGQVPWVLPASVAVCAVGDERGALPAALGPDALAAPIGDELCVVVDATGLDAVARAASRLGLRGAIGPAVAWADAAVSWRRARTTHALVRRDVVSKRFQTPLAHSDDHGELLLLAADPQLSRDLAERVLAPLDGMTALQQQRLAQTLRAWLDHRGALRPISAELGVHPQTVRYRVARLRERFGDHALEDPRSRLQLELALRVRDVVV